MKNIFYLFLALMVIYQCKPSNNDDKIKEIKKLLTEIKKDSINKNLNLNESTKLKFNATDKSTFDLFFDGEVITLKDLGKMIKPIDSQTQYIYFFKEDFDSLFLSGTCSRQRGIRVYLYSYPEDYKLHSDPTKPHPYAGKNTVVLRSMCGSDTIPIEIAHSAYNFGDVCPPNCKNIDKKGNRSPLQVRDGVAPK